MKKFLILCFTLVFAATAFATEIKFLPAEKPILNIQQSFNYSLLQSSKNDGLGISTVVNLDFDQLLLDVGFNSVGQKTDMIGEVLYWPSFFGIVNFGIGGVYHLYIFPDCFVENDLLAGLYLKWTPDPFFELFTRFAVLEKISVISPVKTKQLNVMNTTFDFEFMLSWKIPAQWKFYSTFCSNSYFEYPLFCTTFFSTGVERNLNKKVILGLELASCWIDMFTISANISSLSVQTFLRLKI